MISLRTLLFTIIILLQACSKSKDVSFKSVLDEGPSIVGKADYLDSPFVTAGNRVYMVGHQNGNFPELGWHIKGEMGGIWNHPIKLMDGFDAQVIFDGASYELNQATTFTNYPMANSHQFQLDATHLEIERIQFIPDDKQGLTVQYVIRNTSDTNAAFQFKFIGHSDLRPTWLGERTQMIDGQDIGQFIEGTQAWEITDSESPWSVIFGADRPSNRSEMVENSYGGIGFSGSMTYDLDIAAESEDVLTFTIAGSYKSIKDSRKNFDAIKNHHTEDLIRKRDRYIKLSEQSRLTIPDPEMQQAFEWLKYNCDWLIRKVPELGTGITAGIPDYPWYFGVDSEYALKGYMAIGQVDIVYNTIKLLDSVSQAVNGNGRIIHEMSTNGAVFNPGNINETPQFASLIWDIYKWHGDRAFLEAYFPTIQSGLTWLMEENDTDKNLFPDGFGMMEIHGLDSEMIDVASYTQRAFADASRIALELDKSELAKDYRKTANLLKEAINTTFWSESFNSYADFIGTDSQAIHLIEDAIIRADTLNKPWAVVELQQTKQAILNNPSQESRPFVVHHNWVVNTPMEMGIADRDKALRALTTAEQFVNPFGVFVTGIDRDASAGSDDGSFKGSKVFSYTGAVMTLPTGVQAISENNYGRPDKALNYLERMTRTFNYALPGSIYEVSPDYGMITQAWNIYSYAVPIVQQFFGINPEAFNKTITIKPQMPAKWGSAALENVKISNNSVSVFYEYKDGKVRLKVEQIDPSWKLRIELPISEHNRYEIVEGQAEKSQTEYGVTFITFDEVIIIQEVGNKLSEGG